jgi:hypothetical protein
MLKNLINHCFFGTWPTNFVTTFKKNNVKNPINHGYFGPQANELRTHLRNNISKRIEKKL